MYEIFTDGACSGNPGPGGWGVLISGPEGDNELTGGAAETTNNRMELQAAIEALKSLPDGSAICLTTDSVYVKDGITSWIKNWKARGWKTAAKKPVKNADLWQALDKETARHQVEWHWVKGHAGHRENEMCDELARTAAENPTEEDTGYQPS